MATHANDLRKKKKQNRGFATTTKKCFLAQPISNRYFILTVPPRRHAGESLHHTTSNAASCMLLARVLRWSSCPLGTRVAVLGDGRATITTTSNKKRRRTTSGFVVGRRAVSSSSCSSDAADDLREFMATLGVYFTLPEQGVTSPEILTRLVASSVHADWIELAWSMLGSGICWQGVSQLTILVGQERVGQGKGCAVFQIANRTTTSSGHLAARVLAVPQFLDSE